jgi:hypothetical protein
LLSSKPNTGTRFSNPAQHHKRKIFLSASPDTRSSCESSSQKPNCGLENKQIKLNSVVGGNH